MGGAGRPAALLARVDTLTAVGLCAEVGDFERFAKAEQLMSYIGLVPCENTTGHQRRLGSITKTGSETVLYEAKAAGCDRAIVHEPSQGA